MLPGDFSWLEHQTPVVVVVAIVLMILVGGFLTALKIVVSSNRSNAQIAAKQTKEISEATARQTMEMHDSLIAIAEKSVRVNEKMIETMTKFDVYVMESIRNGSTLHASAQTIERVSMDIALKLTNMNTLLDKLIYGHKTRRVEKNVRPVSRKPN